MTRSITYLCFFILARNALCVGVKPVGLTETNGRIINGENATVGQFPWQVGLVLNLNDSTVFCGGTIISENWILTAAECIYRAVNASIAIGTVDLTIVVEEALATEFIPHEEYDPSTLANNVGLVKLPVSIGFNDIVAPVALSSDPIEGGEEVTVSGFGLTSDDEDGLAHQFLNYMTVTTMTNSDCAVTYGDALLEEMMCTSAGSDPIKASCIADSGGPAILNADSEPVLVAVASFISAVGCESGNPSGFTRIAYHRDWIAEKTGL